MILLISSIPCWLIPVLVGAICAILGYLLGRLFGGDKKEISNEIDVDVYKNRISKLEADLEACKASKKSSFSGGNSSVETKVVESKANFVTGIVADNPNATKSVDFDAVAAKTVFGKKVTQDDLTVVEGIGPKIKELFHSHDVKTWAALADCSVERCQEVLKSGGKRFEIHKPGTWPKQSEMAALGQWQKLKDWQDVLDGGK